MRTSAVIPLAALALAASACSTSPLTSAAPADEAGSWIFAVSGDSRNCGDAVMPEIVARSRSAGARFFWHLGDFRWQEKIDEDIASDTQADTVPGSLQEYRGMMWRDFISRQLAPFGDLPVYLAIGNHELVARTRADYLKTFAPWLHGSDRTYYDWRAGPVAFLSLDNASSDQFDAAQLAWFTERLAQYEADPTLKTLVVGMHEALPDSLSSSHSMGHGSVPSALQSGREVYAKLLGARDHFKKNVYVLASHSHYFMEGIYDTAYWDAHGGVLPGWIVGTAGAFRYGLPEDVGRAKKALDKVYGYLEGRVRPSDGAIRFEFVRVDKADTLPEVRERYGQSLVDFCFDRNSAHAAEQ